MITTLMLIDKLRRVTGVAVIRSMAWLTVTLRSSRVSVSCRGHGSTRTVSQLYTDSFTTVHGQSVIIRAVGHTTCLATGRWGAVCMCAEA